ncbi:putative DNA double-strand break repair helicase, HerA-like [Desulfonema limicola]|uniref:DNA double-strand break repair helicase, HerA-like n=1 Tax=Desulfonema limicola TaxID=45656 RepID=A0A975B421_9BACT|nr:ATP-binding protein [Desulfonema limicola]QTA78415.1 putative DNA double-strand break repair helicase, HerA-like [Desulfonema limicola]
MIKPEKDDYLGKLIGNTGSPNDLKVAMRDSFSARRGEFVRIAHQERKGDTKTDVLGRIVSLSRSNIMYNEALGEGISEVEILPSTKISGETVYGKIELVGYKDSLTNEIRIPRRPLNPGAKVYGVDYDFLTQFYEFSEDTSIHLGNLVGYEKGDNVVPVYLDVNTLATEHLAVLAMTGSGKSYTVGRIIERMVSQMNGSVVVFDPHGEYGKAFRNGEINFNSGLENVQDISDRNTLIKIREQFEELQNNGAGILMYTPQSTSFNDKYAGKNKWLALQLANLDMDELVGILPGLTEAQQRVMDVAIRYWKETYEPPHDIQDLLGLLNDMETLRGWDKLSPGETNALKERSANIAAIRLRRMINEAQSFYTSSVGSPTDVRELVGNEGASGRISIIDLQGVSHTARQVIVALICSEILKAAGDADNPIRPVFIVFEEGHNFAPAGEMTISKKIIKRIAAEGRKFGVGFAIISQRPSKLDSDVTSQCNTIIAMRIKNPDDQRFIQRTSDYFSSADLAELPSISTGEALICGRAIIAPLVVKIGYKALLHGGESPNVVNRWSRKL